MELAAFPVCSPSVIASFRFAGTEVQYEIGSYVASLFFLLFWGIVHFSFVMGRKWERYVSPVAVSRSIPDKIHGTPAGKVYHLYGDCNYLQGTITKYENSLCNACAKRCFRQTSIPALKLE